MSRIARPACAAPGRCSGLAAAVLISALSLAPVAARAEGVQLTTDVGTLGLGAGLGTMFTDSIGARVGFNTFRYSRNGTYSNNDYTGKLKFSSLDVLADWYVIGNFRLTAGLVRNGNKVALEATNPNKRLNLNGQTYGFESADAQIDLGRGRISPYFGLGFGSKPRAGGGLGFHFDVGLLKQDPTATINLVPDATTQLLLNDPQVNATYQANKAQEEQKLRDSISGARNWPVVNLGVTYAF